MLRPPQRAIGLADAHRAMPPWGQSLLSASLQRRCQGPTAPGVLRAVRHPALHADSLSVRVGIACHVPSGAPASQQRDPWASSCARGRAGRLRAHGHTRAALLIGCARPRMGQCRCGPPHSLRVPPPGRPPGCNAGGVGGRRCTDVVALRRPSAGDVRGRLPLPPCGAEQDVSQPAQHRCTLRIGLCTRQ